MARPTATRATVGAVIASGQRVRSGAAAAPTDAGRIAAGSPQNADIQILVIDTSVSRLPTIATATSTSSLASSAGGEQAELGDEAGERRDARQAQRREEEQHGEEARSGGPGR